MSERKSPVTFAPLLHGGDYNPDQWLAEPAVIDEDFRLFPLARVNTVSLGIFSWARLEPEDGRYDFAWLDNLVARLHAAQMRIILATPSGAKPSWLGLRYPEVRRCDAAGRREPQGGRHNHCPTSPVFRQKTAALNQRLAQRYGAHPAVILWHLSNEYGGECHCPLCKTAFRDWLRARYGTLAALNRAWWSAFWSHTIGEWDEAVHWIDPGLHGQALDWRRFVTHQTTDFMRHEIAAVRAGGSALPVTTNLMGFYAPLDYRVLAREIDVASHDSYPEWNGTAADDAETAALTDFEHALYRSLCGPRPWLLMESTPSHVNWRPLSRPKPPGLHRVASLQAIANGSDSVLYFQWRKGRGGFEKFHGAVVDHVGHEHTRVFREVAGVGADLENLSDVAGTTVRSHVAVIFDWECWWAIEQAAGPRNRDRDYLSTVRSFYEPFRRRGLDVDVIGADADLTSYQIVVAPMLYLLRPGVAERFEKFVRAGGTLVATYLTGLTDESDLCHTGGWPGGGLRELLGVWVEEIDTPLAHQEQALAPTEHGVAWGLSVTRVRHYCDVLHLEGATALATYTHDWLAGRPAVTLREHGAGTAIYVGARTDADFCDALAVSLIRRCGLRPWTAEPLPAGVRVSQRGSRVFVLNFTNEPRVIAGPEGELRLEAYGVAVLLAD